MFQGSLEDVKLPDIIQMMSVSAKTGCFILSRDDEEGRIYLRRGDVVHAHLGNSVGESAIYAMSIWESGGFLFQQDIEPPDQTISARTTNILMEVARKLEEWRVLKKKIPSLDLIPELQSLGHKKVSFNTQEWNVLSKINGVNSINHIAGKTQLPSIDVAKLIYGLVASNLVFLREEPKSNPDVNPLESSARGGQRSAEEEHEWLAQKVEKIYQLSKKMLGEIAHPVIHRHCHSALKQVHDGKGIAAIIEASTQIIKAARILEDPDKTKDTKDLAEGLKQIIKEP
jgi:hypothetical protein